MALYQFYLAAVPKAGLIQKHGDLPGRVNISTETGYFESNTQDYWKLADLSPEDLVQRIDKLVNRANWGNGKTSINWKTYTNNLDNDGSMYINEESGKIEELSFRIDLREKDLKFLKGIMALSSQFDFLLMDRNGKLANPDFEEIKELIKTSNAFKFLQDPYKFLEGLDKVE